MIALGIGIAVKARWLDDLAIDTFGIEQEANSRRERREVCLVQLRGR
jgi:hypothetical protein